MALYRGRYYLYHGVAPAVLLFTPWRLVTGHDVPENFALALFCLADSCFPPARCCGCSSGRPKLSQLCSPFCYWRWGSARVCRTCSAASGYTKSRSDAATVAFPRPSFSSRVPSSRAGLRVARRLRIDVRLLDRLPSAPGVGGSARCLVRLWGRPPGLRGTSRSRCATLPMLRQRDLEVPRRPGGLPHIPGSSRS